MTDYYKDLGVPRDASEKDVKQAYRKLARRYHPDVNRTDASAEEKFKQVNEAYNVISDPEKRRKYDRYGDDWEHADRIEEAQAGRGRNFRWSNMEGGDPTTSFDFGGGGLFDELFGGRRQRRRPQAVEHPVAVTLEEAFRGTLRMLELPGGRRLEVKIPIGVAEGSKVRISPDSGRQGDIILLISVRPDSKFKREGSDLFTEVELPLEDAILGGEMTVPTLTGKVALTIPPETQNGQKFRLAGQGMPALNKPETRGNLYATTKVILPTGLSPEELKLFQRLRESRAGKRVEDDQPTGI